MQTRKRVSSRAWPSCAGHRHSEDRFEMPASPREESQGKKSRETVHRRPSRRIPCEPLWRGRSTESRQRATIHQSARSFSTRRPMHRRCAWFARASGLPTVSVQKEVLRWRKASRRSCPPSLRPLRPVPKRRVVPGNRSSTRKRGHRRPVEPGERHANIPSMRFGASVGRRKRWRC